MPIYWRHKSFPELYKFPEHERRSIWMRCFWKAYGDWQTWAGAVGLFLCQMVGLQAGGRVTGVVLGTIGVLVWLQIQSEMVRVHLREELRRRGSSEDAPVEDADKGVDDLGGE